MTKIRKLHLIIGAVCILLTGMILSVITFYGRKETQEKQRVGVILSGSADESGWNGAQYKGIMDACSEMNVEPVMVENVREFSGQCVKKVEELAEQGVGVIFLTSFGYAKEMKEEVKKYKDIVFYAQSSEYQDMDTNMTSYFLRLYQARYLAGIVAGMETKSNRIGYVAAKNNSEVNRGINAFTLGVRRVNKKAEVHVRFTGSWDDEQKEKNAVREMAKAHIDVVTYHQNRMYVIEEAEKLQMKSIGYYSVPEGVSDNCLTAAVCDWKQIYRELIREYLQGKGNYKKYRWLGMEKRAVGLSEYSSEVSEEAKRETEKAAQEILNGKQVFSGRLKDRSGNVLCKQNETMSDDVLFGAVNWFVEGVVEDEEENRDR